ncbi:MAG: hypothetical protein EPN20_03310 [Magnetospirillum sp.]|nr:MAG: hypothetical protein EPN20_03310 [Magnetospirillum sp.]
MKKALVTLVIGDEYRTNWQNRFAPTWVPYARRHGYEIIPIEEYIDEGDLAWTRSPHWQKCLILELPGMDRFDRVVWVDADILINHRLAPDIVAQTPEGRIGAVSHNSRYRRWPSVTGASEHRFFDYLTQAMGMKETRHRGDPALRYQDAGLPEGPTDILNTGVLVLDPRADRDLLRQVYLTGRENAHSIFENLPLSHALLESGRVALIDEGFNVIYPYEICAHYPWVLFAEVTDADFRLVVNAIWASSYFLHFTSGSMRAHADLVEKQFGDLAAVHTAFLAGRR